MPFGLECTAQVTASSTVDTAHATGLTSLDQNVANFSIAFWQLGGQSAVWMHVDQVSEASNLIRYGIRVQVNGNFGSFQFMVGTSSAEVSINVYPQLGQLTGRWQHMALTYDGTTLYGYANGKLRTTDAYSTVPAIGGTRITQVGGYSGGNATYQGKLCDLQVYPARTLTPAEIQQTLDPRRENLPAGCKQRLFRWWGGPGSGGAAVFDESNNGNHMTTHANSVYSLPAVSAGLFGTPLAYQSLRSPYGFFSGRGMRNVATLGLEPPATTPGTGDVKIVVRHGAV